jgi:hypothetical protein
MTAVGDRPATDAPGRVRRKRRTRRVGYLGVFVILLAVAAFVVAAEALSLVRHARQAQASL